MLTLATNLTMAKMKVTPCLLDPVSKLAFRIDTKAGKLVLYGKRKGMKGKEVPFDGNWFERAEMLNSLFRKKSMRIIEQQPSW